MEHEALVYIDFADGPVMVGLCRREALGSARARLVSQCEIQRLSKPDPDQKIIGCRGQIAFSSKLSGNWPPSEYLKPPDLCQNWNFLKGSVRGAGGYDSERESL